MLAFSMSSTTAVCRPLLWAAALALAGGLLSTATRDALGQAASDAAPGPAGASSAVAPAAPATQPTDPDYPALVQDLIRVREKRQEAQANLQKKLKELTSNTTPAAELERRQLLQKRREADLELNRLTRLFQTQWLALSLPEAMRKEYAGLAIEEKLELLATRTAEWRLAVPLPPADLKAAQLSDVVATISRETDTRIVPDWPALQIAGARPDALVAVRFGDYDQPAINVLQGVISAVTNNQAWVDVSHPEAALLTTEQGELARAALGKRVVARVADAQAWRGLSVPLEPVNLTRVPLVEALYPPVSVGGAVLVDWAGLDELGIKPTTLIDVGLPAHRLGHRLLAIAESLEATPAVKQRGGVAFDVAGGGSVVVSSPAGLKLLRESMRLLRDAAGQDKANQKLLATPIAPIEADAVALGEVLAFVSQATGESVAADWPTLEACGLTFKTPLTLLTREAVPLSEVLPLIVRSAPGKPPVRWELQEGRVTIRGPAR
jgi:hypothetical protein